jgi:lysophospholipase L1-like esterase
MLLNVSLLAGVLLVCSIALDLVVSVYLNLTLPETDQSILSPIDRNGTIEEWYPKLYFPTAENFRLLKPDFDVAGAHYGDYYFPSMLQSRTLVDSVLYRHRVSIHVNELGFREQSAMDSCHIFTLGDSFTFGWGVTEGATWPDLLERKMNTSVYNLGIPGSSPKQELMLLEYLLSHFDGHLRIGRLLWMIYEGNDLEDSYAEWNEASTPSTFARAVRGTILIDFRNLVRALREESLAFRLRVGQIQLISPARRRPYASAYTIDGVRLVRPLFHSPTHGYLLLSPGDLETASEPPTYVLRHPNRGELDKTFARMAHLSDSLHFKVTVAIIPTSVRLYAPYFKLLPAPSSEPHLVDYFQKLAETQGFDTISLLKGFEPYAGTEMLYFRDDDHLNVRGSEIAAQLIAEHLRQVGYQ